MTPDIAERSSARAGVVAFESLGEGPGVVLGPGFTGGVYEAMAVQDVAEAGSASELSDLMRGAARDSATLWVLPYECGRWFEPHARASWSPRLRERTMVERDRGPQPVAAGLRLGPAIGDTRGFERARVAFTFRLDDPAVAAERYTAMVADAVELIRAGDLFQVNLAHRIGGTVTGDPRSVAARLAGELDPAFFASVETDPETAGICCSPERFVSLDSRGPSAVVRTDPIKGTRGTGEGGVAALDLAEKDRAELALIVALMRNDLGRVARPGSVRVTAPRRIARHHADSIAHAVGTVEAELDGDAGLFEVLAAAFPPGSITGAPKVRAMQVIGAYERVPRGVYCGTLALERAGLVHASVNIRTVTLSRVDGDEWELGLWVGAGIVADSNPVAEWEETLTKAQPILDALGRVPKSS